MLNAKKSLFALLALAFAGTALAQTVDASKFYKLEFVVKEVEGSKTLNARSFITMAPIQAGATIRASGKVPVNVGNNNTNYFDLGVSIDVRDLREAQGEISINLSADISTIAQDSQGTIPVVRQNRWSGTVFVPAKKPTMVFASDDMSSKRQLQLEVTATPIK